MNKSERPTVSNEDSCGGMKDRVYTHPSYAVIRISNPQGHRVLFGSDIEHSDFIELEIATATLKRGLSTDWIHGDTRPIISVAMSHAQFVSMIQSSGKGSGTPCTLQYAPKGRNKDVERVPSIEPVQSKTDLIKDEIESDTQKAVEMALKAVNVLETKYAEIKGGKTVTKKDLSTLEPLIRLAKTKLENLPSNLKFALKCAEETISTAVHDAQMEIEASAENKLRQLGLEAVNSSPNVDLTMLLSNERSDI